MRLSLAAPALLFLAATAGAANLDAFPRAGDLFPNLLAAPKQYQLGASSYGLNGRARSDLSLGHAWGLLRGSADDMKWQWQWADGGLDAVDLLGELPLTARRGDVSFSGSLFHETSHLGDDHIRRTGRAATRTTATGLRALAALEPWFWLRGYGGASFLLDTAPSPKRWGLQTGLELMSADLRWFKNFPVRVYAAEDLQMPERVGFNPNSRAALGLKIGWKDSPKSARIQAGYYSGHSYYGQFQADREHFADLSLIFEL